MLELHFRGCLHRFWNCLTFLIHIVSRWTTASSKDFSIFSNPSDFKPFRSAFRLLFHINQPGSSLHIYKQSDLLSIHYLWSLLGVPTSTEHFLHKQSADQNWTPDQVAVLCFAVGNGEMYRLAKQSSTLTVEQAKQRKKKVEKSG